MEIINYSKKIIIWVLVITITSCSKYERTNPNDLLGPEGTPALAMDGYEVISDNNGDAKLQKNETATLKVLVKNTGTKVTQITSAVFTSNSSKLVIENFSPDNIMMGYVNKSISIGKLRIKVASNATVGDIYTCNVKLTDKTGNIFNTSLKLVVSELKQNNFSFSWIEFLGFEDFTSNYQFYTKGLTPYIQMNINNNSTVNYNDFIIFTVTSLDAQYPFQYSIKSNASILSGSNSTFKFMLDCLPQNIPDDFKLVLNIAITDKLGGSLEQKITEIIYKNTAKLNFNYYRIWSGSPTPGSTFFAECEVENTGGRTLVFSQNNGKISTTSKYLSNLTINSKNESIKPFYTSNSLVGFSATIASNCPVGTKIPITIELTTSETCPTKFTSVVQLVVE